MRTPSVDVSNADMVPRGDYVDILKRIIAEGHCPFCKEHLFKHHTNPIIREGTYWLVTANFRPYQGTTHHLLFIALPHVTRIGELPAGAGDELVELHRWAAEKYGFPGSSIVWREGATELTGATVSHLHLQVVVGVPRTNDVLPLQAVVGYKPAS